MRKYAAVTPPMDTILCQNIVCQRRTGYHKQYVLMSADVWNPVVVKGPYADEKRQRLMDNASILEDWGTPLVTLPVDTVESGGMGFVVFPNLNRGRDTVYTRDTDSTSDVTYRRLERTAVVKLGDVIAEDHQWVAALVPDVVVALCHLFVLGVGDTTLANILARPDDQSIHVIDYEERRARCREDALFYLSNAPAKHKLACFEPYATPYYRSIAKQLEKLPCDDIDGAAFRRDQAVALLRRFATGDCEYTLPLSSNRDASTPHLERAVQNILSTDGGAGEMMNRGPWNSKTFSGFSVDEAKSAMQKYIRRGIVDKALMAAFELYRMSEVGATAIVTNMYNRLAIIAAEDVGPANFPLVGETIRRTRTRDMDPASLVRLVVALCNSKKTRLGSHVFSAHFRPKGMDAARELGIALEDTATNDGASGVEWTDKNHPAMKRCLEMLCHRNSMHAFNWLREYQKAADNWPPGDKTPKLAPFRRRTHYMAPVVHALTDGKGDTYTQIRDAYWHIAEKRPFLILLVLAHVYGLDGHATYELPDGRFAQEYGWLMRGDYILELDDYVIDKHTKRGRTRGQTRRDFVFGGGLVTNESAKYCLEDYKDVYNRTA